MEKETYYRHKHTAEIINKWNFEGEHIEPKAEEYFEIDDLLATFILKESENYLPDWKALKQAFWEYCYDTALNELLREWEEIER